MTLLGWVITAYVLVCAVLAIRALSWAAGLRSDAAKLLSVQHLMERTLAERTGHAAVGEKRTS